MFPPKFSPTRPWRPTRQGPAGQRRRRDGRRTSRYETLEPRQVLAGMPLITEFLASNDGTLADGDGVFSDWIELHNPTAAPIDLGGWHLTDDADDLRQWSFPALPQAVLEPGEYLVVFASGRSDASYVDAAGYLHTNFRLGAGGEYLALTAPDGTVVQEFAPAFPPQFEDVSYGLADSRIETTLVQPTSAAALLVPTHGGLGATWTEPAFVPDAAWITEQSPGVPLAAGVGFVTASPVPNLAAHWPLDEPAGTLGVGAIQDATTGNLHGTPTAGVTFGGSGANAYTGQAASFANGSIDVPYDPRLNPASFTAMAWVRPTQTSGYHSVFTSRHDSGQNRGYVLYHDASGRWSFWTGTGGSGWDTLDGPAVALNVWQHVAISYDAASDVKRLYVNGNLAASEAGGGQYAPNQVRDLHIGGGGDFGDQYRFIGQIDDVAVFDAALDASVIQTYLQTGVPPSAEADLGEAIVADVAAAMAGVSASAYLRVPFTVKDPSQFNALTLRMQYDDGFVAYLNGVRVATRNAPTSPTFASTATAARPDSLALEPEVIDVSWALPHLRNGANVLAVHGLNLSAGDEDFLIAPELAAFTESLTEAEVGYFTQPTPGAANPATVDVIGPLIGAVQHSPAQPGVGDPLVVTAQMAPSLLPVGNVALMYRVMFGPETAVPMFDDGTRGDALAADGVYTGVIPAGAAAPGQMLRYYVTAADVEANARRAPDLRDLEGNRQSARYFGTVVADPSLTSGLPIFQWFVEDEAASHTRAGTRAAVYFQGEFYDNVYVRQRGGYTNAAVSQKFVFDQSHELWLNAEAGRVAEININGSGADPSYIRQTLAFETFAEAEADASLSFLTLMHVNGSFDRVGITIEQVDEKFLERNGYDPEGALYKFVQRSNLLPAFADTATGVEKKTRLDEDFSDLQTLVNGLNLANADARHAFLFDHLNLPQIVNYLAVRAIIQDADDVRKNFYMYRDTNGTQEWSIFPWDKDFTFNVVGDGGIYLEHPFFGDEEHKKQNANQWNMLYDALFEDPATQQMYLRRLRTLMDEILGTAPGFFEQRTQELFAPADPYPGPSTGGKDSVLSYFPERRNDLFVTFGPQSTPHVPGERIPTAQVGAPPLRFGGFDANPASGDQDQEYLELRNPTSAAVDVSGWTLSGGVEHVFAPGTVIPAGETLFLTPSAVAFRQRDSGPAGGRGLFVQQWDDGHLSSFSETIELRAPGGALVDTLVTPNDPSPAQRFLRISEIHYHPAEPLPQLGELAVDNELFEFVELANVSDSETLNLAGVRFSAGIEFQFGDGTPGSSPILLAPGERAVVAGNLAAFVSRYGTGVRVLGEFAGDTRLSNSGERIKLDDAQGRTIQDFVYDDGGDWPAAADGVGASLEPLDVLGDFGDAANWRSSREFGGSPGRAGTGPVVEALINEVRAQSGAGDQDYVELVNVSATSLDLSGWRLSNDADNLGKFTISAGTTLAPGQYLAFSEAQLGFGLDGMLGDQVWLISTDPHTGRPLHFVDAVAFGGADPGVALGRWNDADPQGELFPMTAPSTGAPNRGPQLGPAVISEIHYSPAGVPPAQAGVLSETDLEFVELTNRSGGSLAVSGWTLQGFGWTFPAASALAANATVLVVTFDPVAQPAKASAFRAALGASAAAPLVGPATGRLDNAGERLELRRPLEPLAPANGSALVDAVRYAPAAPWPALTDGGGMSLHRRSATAFGAYASSWSAATPNPGAFVDAALAVADFDGSLRIDGRDFLLWQRGFGSAAASSAVGDADGDAVVEAADRMVWEAQFGDALAAAVGEMSASAASASGALPAADDLVATDTHAAALLEPSVFAGARYAPPRRARLTSDDLGPGEAGITPAVHAEAFGPRATHRPPLRQYRAAWAADHARGPASAAESFQSIDELFAVWAGDSLSW